MLYNYAKAVIRFRYWVMLATIVITSLMVGQIRHLKITVDPNTMLPQAHPYVIGTNLAERIFGTNYVLVMAIAPKRGDIYQPEVLRAVKSISAEVLAAPSIRRETLMSLSARQAKSIQGTADGMDVRPLMETVPATPQGMAALRSAIERNPLYLDTVVGRNGNIAAVTVSVEKGRQGFGPTLEAAYRIAKAHQTSGVEVAVSGVPMYLYQVEKYAQRMALLFPLALLIVGLLHLEAFRSWQGFFLPLVTALLSVVWGLGLMGLAKVPMDAFNSTTPILILAVTAGHAVQVLKRYYEEYERRVAEGVPAQEGSREAVARSVASVGQVMLVAGGVAILGFFSLFNFEVETIRSFGIFTGLGILCGLLLELTFIPAVRASLKPPKPGTSRRFDVWKAVIRWVCSVVLGRTRLYLYLGMAGISLLFGYGATKISDENSYKQFFSPELPFQRDDQLINTNLGGTNTLYLTFDAGRADGIKDPAVLDLIAKTEAFIQSQPGVGKTTSIADLVRRMNKALHNESSQADKIPDDGGSIAQYLLLYSMSGEPSDFDRYVDYTYRYANLTAYLKSDSSIGIRRVIEATQAFLAAQDTQGVTVHFGGSVPQSSALAEVLVEGKLRNVLQIGLVVLIASALVFRSLTGGILVIIPLLVTVLVNFGVMGIFGIPLNTTNAISAAMAIGVGADYAIYLLYRIREECQQHKSISDAVASALNSAGRAVLYVASAIGGGYAVLMCSKGFNVHIWFGLLIVMSMVVSALSSLLLIPSLVIDLNPRFLGARKAIPLRKSASVSPLYTFAVLALVGAAIILPAPAQAADNDSAESIMMRNFMAARFSDSTLEATYQLINKNGDVRLRRTMGATKLEPNGIDNRRMTRFLEPKDVRNTATLMIEHSDAEDDMWIYLPSMKKIRRLSASNKKDAFIGTDFSYGDVIGHKVHEWNHNILRQESRDGAPVVVIQSIPESAEIAEISGYSKRLSWIDLKTYLTVYGEFYDRDGKLQKVLIQNNAVLADPAKNRWQPLHMEMRNVQTEHRTVIDLKHFEANKGLKDDIFSRAALGRAD